MNLKDKLKEDLKISMKNGDSIKRGIVRIVLSEIAAEDSRRKIENNLDDAGIQGIISNMVKNLSGIPEDKKNKELEREIEVLKSYLPELMSEQEIEKNVQEIINTLETPSLKEIGKVMGAFTAKYKGKADNSLVSKIVKEKLQ